MARVVVMRIPLGRAPRTPTRRETRRLVAAQVHDCTCLADAASQNGVSNRSCAGRSRTTPNARPYQTRRGTPPARRSLLPEGSGWLMDFSVGNGKETNRVLRA